MKTIKVKTGELFIDPKLTKMRPTNPYYVSQYRQAYRAEAPMPYIIIQKGTKRVVSGIHRLTALRLEYGTDYTIQVVEQELNTELEVLQFFAKENATHGNALSNFSRRNIAVEIIKEGGTAEQVASIFNISVNRVAILCDGEVAQVIIGSPDSDNPETEDVLVKNGFEPQHPITKEEYETHLKADRGIPVTSQINQLIRWLKGDLIKRNDQNLTALKLLRQEIDGFLKKKANQPVQVN
jgi:hypothetical protein